MVFKTKLTEMLGIQHPIVQGKINLFKYVIDL